VKSPCRIPITFCGRTRIVAFRAGSRKLISMPVWYFSFISSSARRMLRSSRMIAAMPSITTGSPASSVVITQRGSARRLRALRELTPQVNGYYAQICRTLVIGKPSDKQLEAYSIFAEAQQAAQDLLRPGVDISDVARVQNDVFRKRGFGEYTGPQYTRVRGHNLGLYPDELPHVLENVHYIVKKDMVVIAHPNTYLPLSGYMVFGDTLLLTETGNTRLNKTEKKLFVK